MTKPNIFILEHLLLSSMVASYWQYSHEIFLVRNRTYLGRKPER
jgi:hypothetical protein